MNEEQKEKHRIRARIYQRRFRLEHPEEAKKRSAATVKRWKERHPEEYKRRSKIYQKKYRDTHREERAKRDKERRSTEHYRITKRAYYARTREKQTEYSRTWQNKNLEKCRLKCQRYDKANRDRLSAQMYFYRVGIWAADIPAALLEAKMQEIRNKRCIHTIKETNFTRSLS